MAEFEVKAHTISVTDHPDADRMSLAHIGGYVACIGKDQFASGDTVVYIPEAALVPESILADMNLLPRDGEPLREGKPIGNGGNRVKAIRLRGVLSQGLVYQPKGIELELGVDYAEQLGITKYEPPVPIALSGKAEPVSAIQANSSTENIKKYPGTLVDGEEVVITEKVHGSCCVMHFDGKDVAAASKGVAQQGLGLVEELDDQGRPKNLYWRAMRHFGIDEALPKIAAELGVGIVTLYGEVGPCQDLKYGYKDGEIFFAAFDLRADGTFVDHDVFADLMDRYGIPTVPLLYRGPYSDKILAQHTDGQTVFGNGAHIREGVVVRPVVERYDMEAGRVLLKSISDAYLLRRGATELA